MKQIWQIAVAFAGMLLLCCCACATQEAQLSETIAVYLIPNSYFEFTATDVSDAMDGYLSLGSDYCTDASVVADGLELSLSETQRNNLIARNNAFIESSLSDFKEANELYNYIPDANYQQLSFYFDEELSTFMQLQSVFGVASGYGLNYILLHNTTDWTVEITIYNCHTEKEVLSVTIPTEEASYGATEWEESYRVE